MYCFHRLMEYIKEKHPKVLDDEEFVEEFLEKINQLHNDLQSSNDWNDLTTRSSFRELAGHQHLSLHRVGYDTLFELLLVC